MANNEHPITPPPELVASLRNSAPHGIRDAGVTRELWLINKAYAAGAHRRPKPLSQAEQAIVELDEAVIRGDCITTSDAMPSLRAAELLQRQHLQPVPVSERPPLSHECDEDGHLWLGVLETDALLGCPHFSLWSYDESRKRLGGSYTHFLPYNTPLLPAHALPLPTSEEVEA